MNSMIDLGALQSEGRNPNSLDIDVVSTEELCGIINNEDRTVADAVSTCLPVIANAIDALTKRTKVGGKVVYVGAGTSGRLGVLDASELPPTFSARPEQFVALMAGGDRALRHAQEGAEDDEEQAVRDMHDIQLSATDALIGIAASGRTPYVLSCLRYAKSVGCTTVGVACSSPSAMGRSGDVDFMIEAVTGPEVVTGSTRLKAGTATKMVLNMLSTGTQIKLGKTYGNMMVDVKATNLKLKQRARNIIRELCKTSCPESDAELDDLLRRCGGSVKLAIATLMLGVPVSEAQHRLDDAEGILGQLSTPKPNSAMPTVNGHGQPRYVLCVDGGGSKCAAFVLSDNGEDGTAQMPGCNVTTADPAQATATIQRAATEALLECPSLNGRQLHDVHFSKIWIGLAGFDRPQVARALTPRLKALFNSSSAVNMTVSNDLELLATAAGGTEGRDVCVLVAGTGSIAMAFSRRFGRYEKVGRVGGWGPLLGDDGSGFDIGRQAIRHVLEVQDRLHTSESREDSLSDAVLHHFGLSGDKDSTQDVLSSVLLAPPGQDADARQRIANVAKVVLEQRSRSKIAAVIVERAVEELTTLVQKLMSTTRVVPGDCTLVMTGGLLQDTAFRKQVENSVSGTGLAFARMEAVSQPGLLGARHLLATIS